MRAELHAVLGRRSVRYEGSRLLVLGGPGSATRCVGWARRLELVVLDRPGGPADAGTFAVRPALLVGLGAGLS